MAALNTNAPDRLLLHRSPIFGRRLYPISFLRSNNAFNGNPNTRWEILQQKLKCRHGRFFCFFANNRKQQDQARKALENALGGKRAEFEKWNKEIQKREEFKELGGGGMAGWGGGNRWWGWLEGAHFWEEARETLLTIIGIFSLLLLMVKGKAALAIASNSLLFLLRRFRNLFALIVDPVAKHATQQPPRLSAKEAVLRKWRFD